MHKIFMSWTAWLHLYLYPENTTQKFKICPNCSTQATVSQETCKSSKGKTLVRQEIEEVIIDGNKINLYSHFTLQPKADDVGGYTRSGLSSLIPSH